MPGAFGDRPVAVGLRPEALAPADARTAETLPRLRGVLEVVEPVGNEMFFYLRFAESEVVVRTPPGPPPRCGDLMTLAFDPAKLHFFDADTEGRIARSAAPTGDNQRLSSRPLCSVVIGGAKYR